MRKVAREEELTKLIGRGERDLETLRRRLTTGLAPFASTARSGAPGFGYRLERGTLVIDEGEKAILARMKQLRGDGAGWTDIAATLTSEGHRTRRGTKFSRQGVAKIGEKCGIK